MNDRDLMAARLREARKGAGFRSIQAAASAFGITNSTLTSHENGTRAFDMETAKRYARNFRVKLDWLLGLDAIKAPAVHEIGTTKKQLLMVTGAVAAGVWKENPEWPQDEWYQIEVGPGPYPGAERFALRMEGNSMDKTIPPGSDLECVRVMFGIIDPQIGDVVIAERQRGDLFEMTCKRLDKDGQDWVLRCESTKPEFADLVIRVGRPDTEHHSDDEARIVGIVLNAQQRHFKRRF